MAPPFSILGADGFIGSRLVERLRADGYPVRAYGRREWAEPGADLGHAIYCVGLAGARAPDAPVETLDAHAGLTARLLASTTFASFLYLSSTRLYLHAESTSEDGALSSNPNDPNDLFNVIKLAAEATCLALPHPAIRVARLSNVFGKLYGTDTFLTAVIHQALTEGRIVLASGRGSEKDYIGIDQVAALLPRIALGGRHRLYNVGGGENVSQGAIADAIAAVTGCTVEVAADARPVRFVPLDVRRLRNEFAPEPTRFLDHIPGIVAGYRRALEGPL